MNEILKFSVDNISVLDKIENSLFRKVRIRAFATGENSHTLPIEDDVLKRGSKTIYNKPILWKYNKFLDDAMGHEDDEIPCGFVPESNDNPIRFENNMGKTFLVIDALLWTRYCGKLIEIFERDNMEKDVSVEIATIQDKTEIEMGKPRIKDFVIAGITLLGEWVEPACKGCKAELLEFSKDKRKYLNSINLAEFIKIDNSKESAVDGEWSNPRRKLFTPITKASNSKALLKEAYLIGDFETEEPEISNFKYPHHVIRNDKLVIHKTGLQAAFQRASQQDIVSGKVKEHLLRHYRELGLSTENFSDFNITKEDFDKYFVNELFSNNESVGDNSMGDLNKNKGKEKIVEECNSQNTVNEKDEGMTCKESEKMEEKVEEVKEQKEDYVECSDDDLFCDPNQCGIYFDEIKKRFFELKEENNKLKEENKAYMEKIDNMQDYEELKKFKCDTEKKMEEEKKIAEMQEVLNGIEEHGIEMSDNTRKELMSKMKDFDSIDAWGNSIKAAFFDKIGSIDGVTKIGLPFANANNNTGSIWDTI